MTPTELRSAYDQLCADISAGTNRLSAVLVAETAILIANNRRMRGVDLCQPPRLETLEGLVRRVATVITAAGLLDTFDPRGPWNTTTVGSYLEFLERVTERHLLWLQGPHEGVTLDWLCTMLAPAEVPAPGFPLPAAPYGPDNPRFVWVIGAIREEFPDIPEELTAGGSVALWDRKHNMVVATLSQPYAQAMVLETTRQPGDAPFTALADWLNRLTPETLASENLPV